MADGHDKAEAALGVRGEHLEQRDGNVVSYEYWSEQALYKKARRMGIRGRSLMSKARLKHALRSHWLDA